MSRPASVQTSHVGLEAIGECMIHLSGRWYRAVLEVGSVDFGLMGEGEQEAVLAGYAALLNSLTFPVQILVRVTPVDLEATLARLEQQALGQLPEELGPLAQDYAAFLRQLAHSRTLLERRFYLVVPADGDSGGSRPAWPLRQGRAPARGGPAGDLFALRPDLAAGKQLTARCEELERQLARCGLSARRLSDLELAQLFHACWCPERSRLQRLRQRLTEYTAWVVQSGPAQHTKRRS